MMKLVIKSVLAAAVLTWAVWDLTGNAAAGLLLAVIPLALGISNLMPFAATALPAIALAAAIAARFWPDLGLDAAAATLRDNAQQAAQVLAQRLAD